MLPINHPCFEHKTRRWIRCLAIMFFMLLPWDVIADSDQDIRDEMATRMAKAWETSDFATLESMENEYLKSDARTPSGKRLLAIYDKYQRAFIYITPPTEVLKMLTSNKQMISEEEVTGPSPSRYKIMNQQWDKVEKKIDKWIRTYPNSPNPIIAKAIFYRNRAIYFRGYQWASKVNDEAWPIYHKNYALAKELLIKSRAISRKNPIWFELMLSLSGGQSAPRQEIDALIRDALENGQGYSDALQAAFHYMQPRWGGSYEQMEKFARLANQKSYSQEHGEVYARLYWNLVGTQQDEMNQEFFARTHASWPLLSQSFEIIIQRHPASRNFSGYALFACMAKDFSKTKQLLVKAQTLFYFQAWPRELQRACAPN